MTITCLDPQQHPGLFEPYELRPDTRTSTCLDKRQKRL